MTEPKGRVMKNLCQECRDKATHYPVVGFFGQSQSFCCQCFGCNGWLDKTHCYNYEGLGEKEWVG